MKARRAGNDYHTVSRVSRNVSVELRRLEKIEAREKEHQKNMRDLYLSKTNTMASDMNERVSFYTKDGKAGHYEYIIFEKYA